MTGPQGARRQTDQGVSRDGTDHHEGAAGGRGPLRPPDQALEPEDEAVHLRRAQRHLHHRPAEDPQEVPRGATASCATWPPTAATCCSSAPRSRPRRRSLEEATRCGMFYVNQRWLGGTLTNFTTIRKSIDRLKKLEEMKETGEFERVAKKEALGLEREREKLEKTLIGIKMMERLPGGVHHRSPQGEASRWPRPSSSGSRSSPSSTPTATRPDRLPDPRQRRRHPRHPADHRADRRRHRSRARRHAWRRGARREDEPRPPRRRADGRDGRPR